MNHGVYYTNKAFDISKNFFVLVTMQDAQDARSLSSHAQGWKNGNLVWEVNKDAFTHTDFLRKHSELTD